MRVCLVLFLFLSGCASTAISDSPFENFPRDQTAELRDRLLGKWLGERISGDERTRWLISRRVDGSYTIEFQMQRSGAPDDVRVEFGLWGVRKPIYFTAMRGYIKDGEFVPANVSSPSLYDAYQIVEVSEKTFTYRSFTSGRTFSVTRVADDFALQASREESGD